MLAAPGFEVSLHRSLTQPIMLAGLPRSLGIVLWTTTAALALGLHQVWVLPVASALHLAFAAMARRDPYFFDVLVRALGQGRLLP